MMAKKKHYISRKQQWHKSRVMPLAAGSFSPAKLPPWAMTLCLLALVASVLGLVCGYAGDSANRYLLLDHGSGLVTYYRLWQEYGFPLQTVGSSYSQLFTDLLVPLLFSIIFHNPYIAMYPTSIFNWLVMALGAFLLARRVGAGGVAWLALPLVGLMALLVVLDSTEEIFVTAITYVFRGGLNAMLPLMFWLVLCVLFASSVKIALLYAVVFTGLFVLLKLSYVILPVWFTLPVILTVGLALATRRLKFSSINWKILTGALVVGYLLEAALHQTMITQFFIRESTGSIKATFSMHMLQFSWRQFFVNWGVNIVVKHPLLSLLWAGFLALTMWAMYVGFLRRHSKKEQLVPLPILCALSFFFFAITLGMTAAVVLGKFHLWGRWWHFANHRYFMPAIYIPLFYGIPVLLAFYWPALRRHFAHSDGRIRGAISVFAVIVLVCALPLFRHLPQIGNLATYTSPFLECAVTELNKRELKSGIAPIDAGSYLKAHLSYSQGIKTVPVQNIRAMVETYQRKEFPATQHPFRPAQATDNMPAKIDFAVANWTDERKTMQAPEVARCPGRLQNPRECYDYEWSPHAELFIKPEHITDYYGMPKETFRCEGVDFLVYQ